jgi:hypothetical protein
VALPPLIDWLQFGCRSDSGTWQDTGASTPASSDGDTIARWDDLRGGEPYLFQSTAGSRPSLQTAELGALPCVRFDGSADNMIFSHKLLARRATRYAVLKIPSTGTYTIECGDANSSLQYRMDNLKQRLVDTAVADIGSSTTGVSAATWAQVNVTWDLTDAIFRSNKAADGTATNADKGMNPVYGVGKNFPGSSEFYQTDLACYLLYFGLHTTGERQEVEDWITSEFGV